MGSTPLYRPINGARTEPPSNTYRKSCPALVEKYVKVRVIHPPGLTNTMELSLQSHRKAPTLLTALHALLKGLLQTGSHCVHAFCVHALPVHASIVWGATTGDCQPGHGASVQDHGSRAAVGA
jgi:hypothetical protein